MKIFVTGGTGFVGTFLSRELGRQGHEITILSRRPHPADPSAPRLTFLTGNPTQAGPWMAAVPEHDWVINLSGASIFTRWTASHKKEIHDSRVLTTRNLVAAMAAGDRRQLFCSTSAVGYYGPRGDEELTEDSPTDRDFLSEVTRDWEGEAFKAQELGIRVVVTRFGIVLGRDGGILGKLVPLFRAFAGGPAGDGSQWFSWIHILDLARAFLYLPGHPEISGAVNFTTPNPVRNLELAQTLGEVLHRPSFLAAPPFMLRLALGELAEVVLSGQRVLPQKLQAAGFQHLFPTLKAALADIFSAG